ncbi:MAG: hypothetical protein IID61_09105 [SAR324 cluster bacterium]|nr:hypothetical protein [SAR324 cluster bacterium]
MNHRQFVPFLTGWTRPRAFQTLDSGAARQPPEPQYSRGYAKLYVDHVLQADKGADFDFLVGQSGAPIPRHSHRWNGGGQSRGTQAAAAGSGPNDGYPRGMNPM